MDFTDATNRLTEKIGLADLAEEMGVSHELIRQARLDPSSPSHRSPPEGWQAAAARLARQRARELEELAAELEG